LRIKQDLLQFYGGTWKIALKDCLRVRQSLDLKTGLAKGIKHSLLQRQLQ